jgi:hypothetical protein
MKKLISDSVVVSLLLLIPACAGPTTPGAPTVQQINVISTRVGLGGSPPEYHIGETDQFTATAVYSDSTVKVITGGTWSSTDTNIATVNSSGLVTIVGSGLASIGMAYAGRSASLMIRGLPNP